MSTLTNGQIETLIALVEQNVADREKYARQQDMSLDPNWAAYQKRLITSLEKSKS